MRLIVEKGRVYMKLTEVIKSKKLKSICVTLLEILVIAAVIMGILMTFQSRLKNSNSSGIGIENKNEVEKQENEKTEGIDEYYLEVNIKKSVLIVYQYNKDKSDKIPIMVMRASIGKGVKADKYKLKESYTWYSSKDNVWNKYNSRYTTAGWIQSVNYDDKYSWTLNKKSYNALGTRQSEDANIKLLAKDAQWIFERCGEGTEIKIKKGKDEDVLPMEAEQLVSLYKTCGWEPTDPEKGNPYNKVAKATISFYDDTVFVEKGSEVNYVSNLIAINEEGKNITKNLKYEKFNSSEMGNHKVKYTYKTEGGAKLEATVRYKVVDTTIPIVKLSKTKFTYEVASKSPKDLNKASVKEAIEELVKKSASANEGSIKVSALPKEQLNIGINYVRVVARDSSGNVGSAQAIVEIKVKEKLLNDKYKSNSDDIKESTKKKKEDSTKKKKETKTEKTKENGENNELITDKIAETVENDAAAFIPETNLSENEAPQ